ncbi:MAG TPA: ATP-binding cassette domain-containing protein [Candidatus Paceibacterota bacterium]|nr:ATP-binding cassette domain-containing protein [Candidatus Paceibacterota bacterium]
MTNEDISIHIKGLKKSFGDLKVLDGIDLSVPKGTMLALLGPNGAGKTTTVRILSTLLHPDDGEVTVEGFDVVKNSKKVRSMVGLTGQYAAVDEYLTGEENLIMMGELYHLGKIESTKRATELLKQFDLVQAGKRIVKTYSGGMKRRLDLALSLVATPPVLFLDEPTTGLDPRSRLAMWEVIERLIKDGATILLTTQYLEEADKLADKIAVIDHGKVIALGTADELKSQVGSDTLELVLSDTSQKEKAVSLAGDGSVFDEEKNILSIPVRRGVEDIGNILNKMKDGGVKIESMTVKKPTLDDVFMRLTGHHAEENNQ